MGSFSFKALARPLLFRVARVLIGVVVGFFLLAAALLLLFQDRLIYFPQPYPFALERLKPADARPLHYQSAGGRQTAFYIAPKNGGAPARMWIAFQGNAALALDWLDTLEKTPDPEAGFLLIDYPGFGACEGHPSPQTILESSEGALAALAADLKLDPKILYRHLNVLGYSIGGAAALQLAAGHDVERVVLISPFTSTMAMARATVGWPLCLLLRHRFDNRARLAELGRRLPRPAVVILHGGADTLVPVRMGRELAGIMPGWIEYHEIAGADHITVQMIGENQILKALAPAKK